MFWGSRAGSRWADFSSEQVLESSVPLVHGDSGGPLVDAAGNVIGINYAETGRRKGRPSDSGKHRSSSEPRARKRLERLKRETSPGLAANLTRLGPCPVLVVM